MTITGSSMDGVTWWAYVRSHSGGVPNTHIARAIGISPSSVGRWERGGPDPTQAAAFARAYGRPVLEAFIAARFLTPEEAGERPTAAPSLASLSDAQLLDEVQRRLTHATALQELMRDNRPEGWTDEAMAYALGKGGSDAGTAGQKTPSGGLSAVPDLDTLAASHQNDRPVYEQRTAEQDRAGEEGGE